MNTRLAIAAFVTTILVGLLIWQESRMRLVRACTTNGGLWDGANSRCRTVPIRIFLEKNLKRS
ncbi:MAG: hypothetical protein KDJ36_15170 [Hyphomicrobiaceae bacterium]|nr:hypothetical protein [Hyphomicrobiaceae bacterium]